MKFSFQLQSDARRRPLPHKIVIGQDTTETDAHVLLKLLGFLMFHREHLQIEPSLHNDNIPFTPDLVELDYELRPVLWVECGECSVAKLDKLAVKAPEAEIWVLKKSAGEAGTLLHAMAKAELRRDRYRVIALDHAVFAEVCALMHSRNEVFWVGADFEAGLMQFDFNGLWFELEFAVTRF